MNIIYRTFTVHCGVELMEIIKILLLMLQILIFMSGECIHNGDAQLTGCLESDQEAFLTSKVVLKIQKLAFLMEREQLLPVVRKSCDIAGAVTTVDPQNPHPHSDGSSGRYGFWNLMGR